MLNKTGRLNKQNDTNMNLSEEREETVGETDNSLCASTSTYTINNKSGINTLSKK